MRQPYEPVTPAKFPVDLEPFWGRTVRATASVVHRTVTEIPGSGGKMVKMPVLDAVNLEIAGYDKVLPAVIIMGPAFWRSKAKTLDMIQFEGRLIKEKDNRVGFRCIKGVHVIPLQTSLEGFTEVQDFNGEELWGS